MNPKRNAKSLFYFMKINFYIKTAFAYFVLIAFIGTILRLMSIADLSFNYKFLLHTHSHIAFLGWVYTALFAAFVLSFLTAEQHNDKSYKRQFILAQFATIGMLFSFPFQGYGAVSITFSTLHVLIYYWFAAKFLKDVKQNDFISGTVRNFIKAAFLFMIISSLAPFSLGPIMAKTGQGSNLYYNAIYFYLHFQYNGWFTFSIFALLFHLLEIKQINYNKKYAKLFFNFLFLACIPSYFLSVLWTQPPFLFYVIALVSAILQLIALLYFILIVWKLKSKIAKKTFNWSKVLALLFVFSFSLKIILQLVGAFPYFANLAYSLHDLIIAYLHLVLIGFVTFFLMMYFIERNLLQLNGYTKTGLVLLLIGFFTIELVLVAQGLLFWFHLGSLPYYSYLLISPSFILIVAAILIFLKHNDKGHVSN